MNISTIGLGLIQEFEGCKLDAYKCPAGIWTIANAFKKVAEG